MELLSTKGLLETSENPPDNPVRGEKTKVKQFQDSFRVPQPDAGGGRGEPGLSACSTLMPFPPTLALPTFCPTLASPPTGRRKPDALAFIPQPLLSSRARSMKKREA